LNQSLNKAAGVLLSVLITAALISFISGPVKIAGCVFVGAELWRGAIISSGVLYSWLMLPRWISGKREIELKLRGEVFLVGFLLLIASDFLGRSYVYFARTFSWQSYFLLTALCCFAARYISRRSVPAAAVFAGCVLVMASLFLSAWDGRLIFSDDHPSFMYRLDLLLRQFPFIPFYNPQWNAGVAARDFFATGALNIFLLAYPFLKTGLLTLPQHYPLLICALVTIVLPCGVFAACRILKLGERASIIAGLLAFAPSLDLFEWLFLYGTLGFVCSAGLLPAVFALLYRLTLGEPLGKRGLTALIVLSSLCFCWTLSTIVFVPLACISLLRFPTLMRERRLGRIGAFVLIFLLLNGLWIWTFVRESQVLSFITKSNLPAGHASVESPQASSLKLGRVHRKLRELETKVHPLTVLLFLPGLLAVPDRRLRLAMGGTILWLVLLSGAGDLLKPQLELRRMNVLAAILALPIVGLAASRLLDELQARGALLRSGGLAFLRGTLWAAVLCSPVNAVAAYSNRADFHFRFASEKIGDLVRLIRDSGGEGRTFFLGFILHEFGQGNAGAQDGGHVAPLPIWTGKELIASHFFHARWSAIDPVPTEFRKRGRKGFEEFFDLMNVTSVVAFRREWLEYCKGDPRYTLAGSADRFHLFRRGNFTASAFQEGAGELLSVGLDRIVIRPKSEKLLLRYRYLPALRTDRAGVQISGRKIFDEEVGSGQTTPFEFIELRVPAELIARGETIAIGYRP